MNGKQMIKLLEKNGFKLDRITGSHHIMIKGEITLPVPVHGSKDLKKGLEFSLLKRAGLK